ncbi:MAG: EamA-like protein transporter family [Candidatus Magasanikbacteria bacterium GW2011_GWA2_56_11]|uniref:EamA-like protein transporter family n=1 Tax=Candidatus Magasanikbacteria bacterium GW2011_GWA2_56_11 TaxID=1619044 RepID=A0A0G1YEW2_9BACT|nr:MAG: EamA-like protein transporter family [Candidatus Magasanikbacteria bacterium GW2011_GWA2_56_11]
MSFSLPAEINFTTLAIFSALFGGLANIFVKRVVERVRPEYALAPGFLFIAASLALFSPWFYSFSATREAIGAIFLVILIDGIANYYYFKTFVQSEVSIATPLLSVAPLFTFVFGWFFLAEAVSAPKLAAAVCIVVLLVIFSWDRRDIRRFERGTLAPAIISAVLFGASAIPAKYLLSTLGALNAPTLYMFRALAIGAVLSLVYRRAYATIKQGDYRFIFLQAAMAIGQWLLLYSALSRGESGITVTLANTVPIFTFIFGALFLRERITVKKVVATALVIGLVLVV